MQGRQVCRKSQVGAAEPSGPCQELTWGQCALPSPGTSQWDRSSSLCLSLLLRSTQPEDLLPRERRAGPGQQHQPDGVQDAGAGSLGLPVSGQASHPGCGLLGCYAHMGLLLCPRFVTLYPGDVFLTGTPPGVGVFRKPPVFLKVGWLQGAGTLRAHGLGSDSCPPGLCGMAAGMLSHDVLCFRRETKSSVRSKNLA